MNDLRSRAWLDADGKSGFVARHHLRALGLGSDQLADKPIVGIVTTWSELTPCNAHLRQLADAVRRGIVAAGGVALEAPVLSLGEPFMRPSSMMYRNLMAIDVEEIVSANPMDAAVLLTGCDKTTPAALMGAASADVPAILLTGGPMLNGKFHGRDVGSGTDVWRMTEARRTGKVSDRDFTEFECSLNRSAGHCMTMGTASTMAVLAEAMGMQLPGAAALPAVDSRRAVIAEETGRTAVRLAREDLRPSALLTRASFENAIRVNAAIGGSTNAVLHLLAMAGRARVPLTLDDFDVLGRDIPLLVDLMPSGRFLMEEFAYAGGVPALLDRLRHVLHDTPTVAGSTLLENTGDCWDDQVVREIENPVLAAGSGTAVLRGSLAPRGAVIKVSAASPALLSHEGPALVFDSIEEYDAVKDDDELAVTPDTVLIVRGAGPRGYPGMPEIGNLPMPRRLLEAGVTDMVRVSDARMSGTAYGTCILHVAPEAAIGGPLAVVQTGDRVRLDVAERRIDLLVPDEEIRARLAEWRPTRSDAERGWARLYATHVTQADEGVDLDFLVGRSGPTPARSPF